MTAPFTYLDAPAVTVYNSPPALPTFLDGSLVHQSDLNALSANLRYLTAYVLGGDTTAKPLTLLRQTTGQGFPTGVATVVNWDTADKNTDGAWSASAPNVVYVQTAGFYRITYQGGYPANSSANNQLFILVNGTDIVNNAAATTSWFGNYSNVEITTQLAAGASVQAAFLQTLGTTQTSSTAYGGQRLDIEWLCP